MALVVIDGNNVIGSRPDGWWRDRPAAAARLTAQVDRWQAIDGRPVVLVFDGPVVDEVAVLARADLEVRFAPGRRDAADDAIVELVGARYADEPDLAVATADRGLISRLPPGVAVIGPRLLRGWLEGTT